MSFEGKDEAKVQLTIKEIQRNDFGDLARTWSHILVDPMEDAPNYIRLSQEMLTRID